MAKIKKDKKKEEKLAVFDFVVSSGISQKQADNLLDIICLYLESIDCYMVGSVKLVTNEELEKHDKEMSDDNGQ